jgi:hypothetical protein
MRHSPMNTPPPTSTYRDAIAIASMYLLYTYSQRPYGRRGAHELVGKSALVVFLTAGATRDGSGTPTAGLDVQRPLTDRVRFRQHFCVQPAPSGAILTSDLEYSKHIHL